MDDAQKTDTPRAPEPVRGPDSGIQVPDSASERHLREAALHVRKPDGGEPEAPAADDAPEENATPHRRPSADRAAIAEPWKPDE